MPILNIFFCWILVMYISRYLSVAILTICNINYILPHQVRLVYLASHWEHQIISCSDMLIELHKLYIGNVLKFISLEYYFSCTHPFNFFLCMLTFRFITFKMFSFCWQGSHRSGKLLKTFPNQGNQGKTGCFQPKSGEKNFKSGKFSNSG